MHGVGTIRVGPLARVERALGALAAALSGALVLAEIVVLFAGVCARYLFRAPLIWSDEVAGILFLWLAMLGAALALHRGEHMRMTAVTARLGLRAQAFLDRFALVRGGAVSGAYRQARLRFRVRRHRRLDARAGNLVGVALDGVAGRVLADAGDRGAATGVRAGAGPDDRRGADGGRAGPRVLSARTPLIPPSGRETSSCSSSW